MNVVVAPATPMAPSAESFLRLFGAPRLAGDNEVFTVLWPHVPAFLLPLGRVLETVAYYRQSAPNILLLHELCGSSRSERREKELEANQLLSMGEEDFERSLASLSALSSHGLGLFGRLALEEFKLLRRTTEVTGVRWKFRYIDVSADDAEYEVVRKEERSVEAFLQGWQRPGNAIRPVDPYGHLVDALTAVLVDRGTLIHVRDRIMRHQVSAIRGTTDPHVPLVVLVGGAHDAVHEPEHPGRYLANLEDLVCAPGSARLECEMTLLQRKAARGEPLSAEEVEQAVMFLALDSATENLAPFDKELPAIPLRHTMSSKLLEQVSPQDRIAFREKFQRALKGEPLRQRTAEQLAVDCAMDSFDSLRHFLAPFKATSEVLEALGI